MNKRIVFVLAVLLSLLPRLFSADTNATTTPPTPPNLPAASEAGSPAMDDLKDLVTRINEKIKQDKTNDLADNLKEFDALVAKHKEAKPEERVQILLMKAQLYIEVLGMPEKALEVFKQIKHDFPATQINGNTDEVINSLQGMIEKKKIRDALAPGMSFPDFNVTDVAGNPLSISQFKGKVVMIDFWATWCMPCLIEMPEVQKAYAKFHDQGLEIVGVSLDEEKGRLQQFLKDKKIPWPQYFDGMKWENKLAVKYGVDSVPTAYLLDRDGKIIGRVEHSDDLDSKIGQALKK